MRSLAAAVQWRARTPLLQSQTQATQQRQTTRLPSVHACQRKLSKHFPEAYDPKVVLPLPQQLSGCTWSSHAQGRHSSSCFAAGRGSAGAAAARSAPHARQLPTDRTCAGASTWALSWWPTRWCCSWTSPRAAWIPPPPRQSARPCSRFAAVLQTNWPDFGNSKHWGLRPRSAQMRCMPSTALHRKASDQARFVSAGGPHGGDHGGGHPPAQLPGAADVRRPHPAVQRRVPSQSLPPCPPGGWVNVR